MHCSKLNMTIMIKYLFWSLFIWKTSIYSATMWSVWYNYSFFCSFFLYTVINGNSKKCYMTRECLKILYARKLSLNTTLDNQLTCQPRLQIKKTCTSVVDFSIYHKKIRSTRVIFSLWIQLLTLFLKTMYKQADGFINYVYIFRKL